MSACREYLYTPITCLGKQRYGGGGGGVVNSTLPGPLWPVESI